MQVNAREIKRFSRKSYGKSQKHPGDLINDMEKIS